MPSNKRNMTPSYIVGYACGPTLPGLCMVLVSYVQGWDPQLNYEDYRRELCVGLAFVLFVGLFDGWIVSCAVTAASRALVIHRETALKDLQEAFRTQDIERLERAILTARRVELQLMPDGEAVMGMANQTIGEYKAVGCSATAFQGALAVTGTRQELNDRVLSLEKEVAQLEAEHRELSMMLASRAAEGQPASSAPSTGAVDKRVSSALAASDPGLLKPIADTSKALTVGVAAPSVDTAHPVAKATDVADTDATGVADAIVTTDATDDTGTSAERRSVSVCYCTDTLCLPRKAGKM